MIKNSFFEKSGRKSGLKSLLFKIPIIHIREEGITLLRLYEPLCIYSIPAHGRVDDVK